MDVEGFRHVLRNQSDRLKKDLSDLPVSTQSRNVSPGEAREELGRGGDGQGGAYYEPPNVGGREGSDR